MHAATRLFTEGIAGLNLNYDLKEPMRSYRAVSV